MPYADPAQTKAYKRRYHLAHKEKIVARSKKHYADHREDRKTKRYEQYWDDPEGAIQASQQYYEEHKNEILAKQQLRRDNDPELRAKKVAYSAQWVRDHPEQARRLFCQGAQTRRARKLDQFVEHIDPQVVFDTHKGICGICNKPIQGGFHVDHVIPLSKGGEHSYANTQPAHPKCNLRKGAKIL
jgi:5-methylcytosine-specific restriction endonuclease McrA